VRQAAKAVVAAGARTPGPCFPGGRAIWATFAALAVIALIPLAVTGLPPILDYPNHMARMHLLAALPGSADLARWYRVDWSPIPDLALDAIVPELARIMPVEQAMRLALAAILLGLAGGCVTLHRVAFGRWSFWPLAGFMLLYNRMLLWGFLNYLAGLALALWAIAAWLAIERRPAGLRAATGAVIATMLYFAHLAAFGCYGITILALSIALRARMPAIAVRAIPAFVSLLPAAALFLMSRTAGAPGGIAYGNPLRKLDLPVSIFDNYDRVLDGATFVVLLVAVIVGLARGALELHPRLRWSMLALLAAFLVLPSRLLATSGIDHRLPIAIALLFVAASDWSGLGGKGRRIVAIALGATFLARLAVIGTVWREADLEYESLRPALAFIGTGDAVAVAASPRAVQAGGIPLYHFPTLAVIRRDAFVPTLFADPSQQPIAFTPAAARLAAEAAPARLWQYLARGAMPALPGYDDLMIVDPPRPFPAVSPPASILFDAPRLILIRLKAPAPK
jgi:hypothetical protein